MFLHQRWVIVAFFLFIAASQKLFTPAYDGYLFAFVVLLALVSPQLSLAKVTRRGANVAGIALAVWLLAILAITFANGAAARDVLRDLGAVLAFLIGRHAIALWFGPQPALRLLQSVSTVGLFVAFATLFGAALAYHDGASAYFWRGEYVIMAANWLPFALVANVALAHLTPDLAARYGGRIILCLLGVLASLSRTDLLLLLVFGLAMVIRHGGTLLKGRRTRRVLIVAIAVAAVTLPPFIQLEVVQQRIAAGADEDDLSVGWRLLENAALLDRLVEDGIAPQVLGYGLGARVALPPGVEGFDGNDSIPLLHNSYLTVVLKAGAIGLVVLLAFLVGRLRDWRQLRDTPLRPYAFAGLWIVLFIAGKSVTLQGLTEWSQLLFFGVGCFLVSPKSYRSMSAGKAGRRAPQRSTFEPKVSSA